MGLIRKHKLNPFEVLDCVLAVDGAGSLIDADTVDGKHAADIVAEAGQEFTNRTSYSPATNKIPMYNSSGNIKSSAPVADNDVVTKAYFEEHKNDGITAPSLEGYATEEYVTAAIANAGHMTAAEVQAAITAAIGQVIGGSY